MKTLSQRLQLLRGRLSDTGRLAVSDASVIQAAIDLAKRYEDAPVGNCVACDFEGYERPTWHVIDDRDAVPLTLRGRVRIVMDKEG